MAIRKFNQPSDKKVSTLAIVAGLGVLGFVAYKYWWLPQAQAALAAKAAQDPNQVLAAQALLAQAQKLQQQNPGMSLQQAFEKLGTVGCQAVGAYYGVPPQASGGVCALAVHLGTELGIITTKYAYKYGKIAVEETGKALYAGGQSAYQGGKLLLYDAPKFATEKTYQGLKYVGYTAPVAITRGTARYASQGVRAVGSGIESGVESVGSGIKSGFKAVGSIFGI